MRRPLVIGNWKMNGSLSSNAALLSNINAYLANQDRVDVGVCPSFVYLPQVAEFSKSSSLKVGAQTLSEAGQGAFTGEISASMLKEFDVSFVLVGHSERRVLFGETDEIVAKKVQAALAAGLTPVLCVGETLDERNTGATESVIERQVRSVLDLVGVAEFAKLVIAYEPVWAIGTGETATPEQAQEVHALIRGLIAQLNSTIAESLIILYGGSVNAGNAKELMKQPDVDGGLVGGASLKSGDFVSICKAAIIK